MRSVPPSRQGQVTFRNYREPPFSRWAFRDMGAPLNVLMIPRGGAIAPLGEQPDPRIGQIRVPDSEGVSQPIDTVLETSCTDGFLVLQGRQILYERYFCGLTPDSQHIWFSATKSLTSTALGLLVEEGKIDLSVSPVRYIPELKGSGFERVTLQDVLDHTTAIDFKENYLDVDSDFFRHYGPANNMGFVPGAREAQPQDTDIYGIHDFLCRYIKPDPQVRPGEVFDYNSANADLAGWLISRVSGVPYESFVHRHIWAQLGCEHDAYIAADRAYMAVATGGMNSTLRDMARFGRLILQGGEYGGQQVIPGRWVDATLNVTASHRDKMKANEKYQHDPWVAYHNMWWILDPEAGEYCAVGIHGQMIYLHRSKGLVICVFSSQPAASNANNPLFRAKMRASRAIADCL